MRREALAEGLRWLEQAQTDLRWARHLWKEGAYYLVCFLAQQAAEKALKGFLYAQGEELVIGHSVRQLCGRAGEYDPYFQRNMDDWGLLDSYYIPTRYPNGLPDDIPARVYNRPAADGALLLADQVMEAVAARLSKA
ncbi:HEPN domain-containing protein [Desulfacinum infernum DSM 9756]|uniref:HEPN domain-containing protein n=1 Tax=Desulfacinum infernum DSM 9756 TaxID=1121391 RepID=A0A1M5J1Q0_9BACT|nr:HEPN domain-containing protein [Desulfacinum infernum]SHG34295.1 HEPN domain-containing protein [Desulfacinum infernum DSM 9756]